MTTLTPTVIDDLTALWNQESRSFLRYVVEESSPVGIDELDEVVLMALSEIHDREAEVAVRLLEVWDDLGVSPDLPCYALGFSNYNYMTPVALGRRYLEIVDREIAHLEEIAGRQREESVLAGCVGEIVTASIAVRSAGRAALEDLLRPEGGAGGVAVEGDAEGRAEG